MQISKRQRRLAAKENFKKPVGLFQPIDLQAARYTPEWMTRAFKNNRYIVMINDKAKVTTGYAIRAMVQKHDDTPIVNHWSEMQKIKNELFGEKATAVEYYPSVDSLEDNHNIYWMWVFPEGVLPLPI